MNQRTLLAIALIAVSAGLAIGDDTPVRFDHFHLFTVRAANAQQLDVLQQIENGALNGFYLWNEVAHGDVTVMIDPNHIGDFEQLMAGMQFTYSLQSSNVQEIIDNQQPKIRSTQFDWTSYRRYDEIYAWLDEQLAKHSDVLREVEFGLSHEGRPIRAVHLSRRPGNPAVIIEANVHAREWITSATATWWLNELLTSNETSVRQLSETLDWYIIPVFNVDGFDYSHRVNRLWRKNRNNHAHLCAGVDINRNFDFHWMENDGASQNPCSEAYAGPAALSEVEARNLNRFVSAHANQTRIYLALHSYGQMILYPYGFTRVAAPSHSVLEAVALKTRDGFAQYNGTAYRAGTPSDILYYSSGITSDWAYGAHNIPIAFTLEMRGALRGPYGFLLPADQIIPNCWETRDALIAMVSEARRLNVL